MSARSLVIGLDGADLDVVQGFGPKLLPTLHALMERGAFARLESVKPPATLPNWLTFLTGVDPGGHGVFDFTDRKGYTVEFRGGTARQVPTFVSRLDALGLKCACLGFPGTYPPEKLRHGCFVSGWDSPVAFRGNRSFVWPPELYDRLGARSRNLAFDDVDEFHADDPGWIERLPNALVGRVERKTTLAAELLADREWDLFACYFGESDTASHYLWATHDKSSPRRWGEVTTSEDGLRVVYEALDRAVAALIERAGSSCEITILSDHGSGGSSDKVLYLNRALAEAGLLRFRGGRRPWAALKAVALRASPPALRQWCFRSAGSLLPNWLESRTRFGGIDWQHTVAFSEELNYFPSVHLNLRGREPNGAVARHDIVAARARVRRSLEALRDPWTGERVIERVWDREELYRGPFVERAPDLLLELRLDHGYSYNLMPTASAPAGTGAWRRLAGRELLGRKGRSLPGSHRSHGLLILAGPQIAGVGEMRAGIIDVAPTVLARMNVAVSADLSGRVLWEALRQIRSGRPLPQAPSSVRPTEHSNRLVAGRLRALGYID